MEYIIFLEEAWACYRSLAEELKLYDKTGHTLTRTHLQLKLHEYKINFLKNVEISIYILYINFSAHHVNNHDNPQYVITAK